MRAIVRKRSIVLSASKRREPSYFAIFFTGLKQILTSAVLACFILSLLAPFAVFFPAKHAAAAADMRAEDGSYVIKDPEKRLYDCETYNYVANAAILDILERTRFFIYQCTTQPKGFIAVEKQEFSSTGIVLAKFSGGEDSDWIDANLLPHLYTVVVDNYSIPQQNGKDYDQQENYKKRLINVTFQEAVFGGSNIGVSDLLVTIRIPDGPPLVSFWGTGSDGKASFDSRGAGYLTELAYKDGKPVLNKLQIYGIKKDPNDSSKYIYGSRIIDANSDFSQSTSDSSPDILVYRGNAEPIMVTSSATPPISTPESLAEVATKATFGSGGECGTANNVGDAILVGMCNLTIMVKDWALSLMCFAQDQLVTVLSGAPPAANKGCGYDPVLRGKRDDANMNIFNNKATTTTPTPTTTPAN